MKLILKAFTKQAEPVRIFLYHGVKNPEDVEKILRGGFDLTKIQSNWISGYGVACFTKADGVRKLFRKNPDIPIIQMLFDGNLMQPWDAEAIVKPQAKRHNTNWSPADYNKALINAGIDALWTESPFKGIKEVTVHNLEKISQLTLVKG